MLNLRFGKEAPVHNYQTFRFENYLLPHKLPPLPDSFTSLDRVLQNFPKETVESLFPLDGNGRYGNCTIAGLAHFNTLAHGMVRIKNIPTEAAVNKFYFRLTNGADTGLVMANVLNSARKTSLGNDKVLAYARVDRRNRIYVRHAIQMFGGVYFGFQVPENCMEQFEVHEPWQPGRLTNSGHAVVCCGWQKEEMMKDILTWGTKTDGTQVWWDECADECWVPIFDAAREPGFVEGFNFNQLLADLALIAS